MASPLTTFPSSIGPLVVLGSRRIRIINQCWPAFCSNWVRSEPPLRRLAEGLFRNIQDHQNHVKKALEYAQPSRLAEKGQAYSLLSEFERFIFQSHFADSRSCHYNQAIIAIVMEAPSALEPFSQNGFIAVVDLRQTSHPAGVSGSKNAQ